MENTLIYIKYCKRYVIVSYGCFGYVLPVVTADYDKKRKFGEAGTLSYCLNNLPDVLICIVDCFGLGSLELVGNILLVLFKNLIFCMSALATDLEVKWFMSTFEALNSFYNRLN